MKAVLFDLDGTLANTLTDIAAAMNYSLEKNGLPGFQVDDYRYMVGDGISWLAARAVTNHQDKKEKVQADYQARYSAHALDTTAPYEGIPELLTALKARGLKLVVLSNKPDPDTKQVIEKLFPSGTFDIVRGALPHVPVKPDPTAALRLAAELGYDPSDFLYLGDTSVDMTCAIQTGMHPIGVLWGFRDAEELQHAGAEAVISHPMELLDLLR